MPPRKKREPSAPSTMKELKDTLWKAADRLRGELGQIAHACWFHSNIPRG